MIQLTKKMFDDNKASNGSVFVFPEGVAINIVKIVEDPSNTTGYKHVKYVRDVMVPVVLIEYGDKKLEVPLPYIMGLVVKNDAIYQNADHAGMRCVVANGNRMSDVMEAHFGDAPKCLPDTFTVINKEARGWDGNALTDTDAYGPAFFATLKEKKDHGFGTVVPANFEEYKALAPTGIIPQFFKAAVGNSRAAKVYVIEPITLPVVEATVPPVKTAEEIAAANVALGLNPDGSAK